MQKEITQEVLHTLLTYSRESGEFSWKAKPFPNSSVVIGKTVGAPDALGYKRMRLLNKTYLQHRLAWLYVHGEWPSKHLDHINGNPSDNRIENLRLATDAENAQNIAVDENAGAIWSKSKRKWLAKIRADGTRHHLGYYSTQADAAQAYRIAKLFVHRFQPTVREIK